MTQEPYRGFDPDIKKFFRKILWSSFLGFLWLIGFVIAGIYYELAYIQGGHLLPAIGFYFFMVVTLFLFLRYLKKAWK